MLITWLILSAPLAVIGAAVAARWRGKRRNRRDACAHCAGPLYAEGTFEGPSLLEGLLICAHCAARSRARLRAEIGLIALFVTTAVVATTVFAARTGGFAWFLPLVPIAEYGALFGAAVAWMKSVNRRQSARLAATRAGSETPLGAADVESLLASPGSITSDPISR